MGRACGTYGWHQRCKHGLGGGDLTERDHSEDLGVDRGIILPRQAMYVQRKILVRSCDHCCRAKVLRITYSERGSVALGIHHAMRMCRIILSSVACLYHIFPPHLINGRFSKKKITKHKMCVLTFSPTFVWNISHSTKISARYDFKNV